MTAVGPKPLQTPPLRQPGVGAPAPGRPAAVASAAGTARANDAPRVSRVVDAGAREAEAVFRYTTAATLKREVPPGTHVDIHV